MSFPSIRSSNVTNGTVASATPVVNLPATIRAGDTIIVLFRVAVAGAIGWPDATWTEFFDASPDASDDQMAMAWRKADGTEGATITLSCTSGKFAAVSWAIQDAADPTLRAPELSTVATGTTPTQPNATTVTPTGGAKDYLYGTIVGMEGEATNPPTYPTNYTLGQQDGDSGTASTVGTNCMVAGGWRQLNAASEDPGAWSYGGTLDDWTAYAIAVHPADPVTTPLQTEWDQPNPLGRSPLTVAALTIGLTLLQSTLTPVEAAPFTPTEWPVPLRSGSLFVSLESRPSDSTIPSPFAQTDWLSPRSPIFTIANRAWTFGPPPSTLAAEAAVPFTPSSWPVPLRAPQAALGTWLETRKPYYVDLSPANQSEWPSPWRNRATPPPLEALNLLGTTLGGSVSPFAQTEWRTPTGQPYPIGLRTQLDGRKPFHVDLSPANQWDWPNPRLTASIGVTRETPPNLLLGVLARPFAVFEWATPTRGRIALEFGQPQNLVATTLATPAAAPLIPIEWVTPRGREYPTALRTWLQTRQAYHVDTMALRPLDWPNPLRAGVSLELRTAANNLQQSTLGSIVPPAPPFVPIEWANPVGRPYAVSLRTLTDGRKAFHVDLSPFGLTDWPNPRGPAHPIALRTWANSPFQLAPAPFVLSDWPLPRGVASASTLRPFQIARALGLLEPLPSGRLQDWPNPRGPRAADDLKTWLANLQESTLAPGLKPFGLSEWPNPRGRGYPHVLRTWVDWRELGLVDIQPFALIDWPNPGIPAALGELRRLTQATGPMLLVAFNVTPDVVIAVRADIGTILVHGDAGIIIVRPDAEDIEP